MSKNNTEEKSNKKKKTFKILDIIIPVICSAVIIYAGYNLYQIYHSYSEAAGIYNGLALYVSEEEDGSVEAIAMEEAGFPYVNVDYESLSEINSDFLGWLYFPIRRLFLRLVGKRSSLTLAKGYRKSASRKALYDKLLLFETEN